ncbi:TPA: DNA double-strand break repair nuclease NurA [Candidatus Bipolaricaulota bacterium]|nr:DNA double-strand break repair nuclease NurA [Candidatus Bipolaricaulota bacterium]
MMLPSGMKRRLLEEIRESGGVFSFDPRIWREEARRAFSRLKLDGEVQALTPPGFRSGSVLELASRPSPFRRVFGLDGGSTRPVHFANGLTLCANQAVMVSEPPMKLRGLPLEAFRTMAIVSHSFAPAGGPISDYLEEGPLGRWRIHITRDYLRGEVDHVLKGLADSASEARQALRLVEPLELSRDDLLLLDGNIFPIGLYYLVTTGGLRREVDLISFPGALQVLAQHLRLAEALAASGTACAGINKTPQTAYLLGSLPEEGPWAWADDRQFIRAIFQGLPKDELGWTSWFLQVRYRPYPRARSDRSPAEGSDIFRELEWLELSLPPEDYYPAYFFVFDPRAAGGEGTVLKVEVPQFVFKHHDPEVLQGAILGELARGNGVPHVIRRADSQARITQAEREALIRGSGLPLDLGYNQGRRESW